MKMRVIILLIIILTISTNTYAQYIEGVVIDKKTKIPLAGVNLRFGEKGYVSNKSGEFKIKRGSGKIFVSHIGYETTALSVTPQNSFYRVELVESIGKLPEVTVNSNARSIVNQAFMRINQNYPQKLHTYEGFITEYNRFNKKSYIYQLEAFIKIEQEAYNRSKSAKVEVLHKKSKTFYNLDTLLFVKWQGTPRIVEYANFVNEKADFINPSKNDKFSYNLIDITAFGENDVYIISFEPIKKAKRGSGKLYIDYESLGFVGLDYQFENKDEDTSRRDVKVRYEQINKRWYLQNITYDENSNHKRPFSEKKVPTEIHLEFQRTKLDTLLSSDKKTIDYTKNFQRNDILLEVNVPTDSLFWRENITKGGSPDKDFERFLASKDSLRLYNPLEKKNQEIKFKSRFVKSLFQGLKFEAGLGTFPVGMSANQIDFFYQNNTGIYSISDTKEVNRFNNSGYFLGWSIPMARTWNLSIQSGRNLPGSGLSQRLFGGSISKKFTTKINGHPFFIAPTIGIDFLKTSKSFKNISLPAETAKSYDIESENICPILTKEHVFLSTGIKFIYEINRRKSLFLNVKYNTVMSDTDYLQLQETSGFFLFRGSHKVYDLSGESKMKTIIYPISFQIGLNF